MRREIPGVRIFPMSDKAEGFRGRSIEDVQRRLFLRDLPARGSRFRYPRVGLNARAGTVVLFQYKARVIASAVFLRDEKIERPTHGAKGAAKSETNGGASQQPGGTLHFEAGSFRTFAPVDADAMRKAWPGFRAFGHVRQFLNPAGYPIFKRRLKRVSAPVGKAVT